MNKETCLEIQALVDGELDHRRREVLRRQCAEDAESRELSEALSALREVVRHHEPEHRVPESREFYWSQIQRQIAAADSGSCPAPEIRPDWGWLRWLVPMMGAAAVAALLALPRLSEPSPLAAVSAHFLDSDHQLASSVTYRSDADGVTVHWIQ